MASHRPPDFSEILARITAGLEERDVPFMLIGGQAVLLHGEPRLTQDIDVTLGLPPDGLILHKLFAGRARDIEDVRGVVRRKGGELDWEYLERWAEEFASVPGRERLPEQVADIRGGCGVNRPGFVGEPFV